MKKILAVTLNPCVDYTLTVPSFAQGKTNPVKRTRKDIAGKGINVCNYLKNVDAPVIAAGFDFVDGRVLVKDALDKRGIPYVLTNVSGNLRTNIKVIDPESGEMTEMNQKGEHVCLEKVMEVKKKICQVLDGMEEGSIMAVCGSVPTGVPADFYAQLIEEGKSRRIFTILDASGDLMRQGVKAKPDMIKPNLHELAQLLGKQVDSLEEIVEGAEAIRRSGVSMVCVSMGPRGALLSVESGCWYGTCPDVHVRGMQGAGDALVAAMAHRILDNDDPESLLRMGMAAANASIQLEGTQMAGPLEVAGMLGSIRVEKVK